MTLNRQAGLDALHGGDGGYRGRESAGTFLQTYCPQPRTSSPEGPLLVAPAAGGLAGYLLGWTGPLVFCSGLVALAGSPLFEVAVPRWFILAEGAGCALLGLLALLLTRTWQQRPTVLQHLDESIKHLSIRPPCSRRPYALFIQALREVNR
jgi:hypothetical protein